MSERLFYVDPGTGEHVTYEGFVRELKNADTFEPYCKGNSYLSVLQNILLSLLSGNVITLLDADFTDSEIEGLLGDRSLSEKRIPVRTNSSLAVDNLLDEIRLHSSTWQVTLFTSGTTGRPKSVSHTFESITRFVKDGDRHRPDVWGLAYNLTHMAGLQVFFQALLNLNPIVRLFGLDRPMILSAIDEYQITHLSATPTFYRLLLPPDTVRESVSRITSGGERFDASTSGALRRMFPNARFTNVYASTEAGTLLASRGNDFEIKPEWKDRIQVRDGELLVHRSLLGDSENVRLIGDWYATGDLVEIVREEPLTFRFVSRKTEMINVGGYKVNPLEVEDAIRQCPGVRDVHVYAKPNRILGSVICCEVVREDGAVGESDIREFLRGRLQEFKIPRMIKFVEALRVTRTGKLSRI